MAEVLQADLTTQGARSLQLIPVMVAHVLNTHHIFHVVETVLKPFMLKLCREDWNIAQHLR